MATGLRIKSVYGTPIVELTTKKIGSPGKRWTKAGPDLGQTLAAALATCFLALACVAAAAQPENNDGQTATANFTIGAPAKYENLLIFPVLTKAARNEDRFTTLDEGLKSGTIQIYEVGAEPQSTIVSPGDAVNPPPRHASAGQAQAPNASEQSSESTSAPAESPNGAAQPNANPPAQRSRHAVGFATNANRLMLVNDSAKPLYLMPGEVIVGGGQDRTVARETIIPPGKNPVAIDVFCVEHGRSSARTTEQTRIVAGALLDRSEVSALKLDNVARAAQEGQFNVKGGVLDKGSRQAAQGGYGQQDVWSKVAANNAATGARASSGTFSANYYEPTIAAKLEPYANALRDPVLKEKGIVGVIVAVNGKAQVADIFESTSLFRKFWPQLLKSYALDAAKQTKPLAAGKKKGKTSVATQTNSVSPSAQTDEAPTIQSDYSVTDAQALLDEVVQTSSEKAQKVGGLVIEKRSARGFVCFSAIEAQSEGGKSNFNSAIHSTVYAK